GLLERILGATFRVTLARDGPTAIEKLASASFDLVLSDIRMPGAGGVDVLKAVKRVSPSTQVLLMTAYATIGDAVEAIKLGAYDYVPKPFDPDELHLKVARALEHKRLLDRTEQMAEALRQRYSFERLIGSSEAMQRVFSLLAKAARVELPVLLTGEIGTGKDLAARAIHYASRRSSGPFVAFDCGAGSAEALESELFGGEGMLADGARGALVRALGGTLLLDEIDALPVALQIKLSRALQDGTLPGRADAGEKLDVRVLATTRRDLQDACRRGAFREDLLYRLKVLGVELPPLRHRREDIVPLANHFLAQARPDAADTHPEFEPDALKSLVQYDWPGNVRELEGTVARAAAVSEGRSVSLADLAPEVQRPAAVLALPS
ncbi:MAG TPA: sigma-54 dependent transcriptional regulator, partial [Myxococcota bacterium]|nr:sigma-54 dependent transcriptional regulator [Myxococcota bacterium]